MKEQAPIKATEIQRGYQNEFATNFEAPAYPSHIKKEIETLLGNTSYGGPVLRLVWGMSPDLKIFHRGAWHMKYPGMRAISKKLVQVKVVRPDGSEHFIVEPRILKKIKKKQPESISGYYTKNDILIFFLEEEVKEVGLPYFIVERFAYPLEFGDEEDWKLEQYEYEIVAGKERGDVDLQANKILRDYPRDGEYVQWMVVEQKETGLPRLPDQALLEEIKLRLYEIEQLPKNQEYLAQQMETQREDYQAKMKEEWEKELEYAINERKNRLLGNPSTGWTKGMENYPAPDEPLIKVVSK